MAQEPLADRWRAVCEALGLHSYETEYRALLRAWRSWGRHYHSLTHLEACLREFDTFNRLAEKPAEVEIALWFHDAVYRTYRRDNELKSAEWALRFMQTRGATADSASRVSALVLATAHSAELVTGDVALTVDIDLSILGQAQNIYDQFERDVRKEYWWVPKQRYLAARSQVLRSFLDRSAIYRWPQIAAKYETSARSNLRRALEQLAILQ